jgi:tetratricopeptide (TPR) repeat protein
MPKSRASAGRPARAKADSRAASPSSVRGLVKAPARSRPEASNIRPRGLLSRFEHGVAAMQRHDFAAAADHFRAMLDHGFQGDAEVRERARVYLLACDRQLAAPPRPGSTEDLLYAATLAYNRGALDEAEQLLSDLTGRAPDHDFAHFMLAIVRTGRGRLPDALAALGRAVELDPENRLRAMREPDLQPLRQANGFERVVGGGQSRRPR